MPQAQRINPIEMSPYALATDPSAAPNATGVESSLHRRMDTVNRFCHRAACGLSDGPPELSDREGATNDERCACDEWDDHKDRPGVPARPASDRFYDVPRGGGLDDADCQGRDR